MFNNHRYLTCGVDAQIPMMIQLFLWDCVDKLPPERDYIQVFELSAEGDKQRVVHRSEQPYHRAEYLISSTDPITEKLYIIDDEEHSTMLLASEY